MISIIRSKKKAVVWISAALLPLIVLGLFLLSYTLIPEFRRQVIVIPAMQEIGLLLYRLGHPSHSDFRRGEALPTEIVIQSPMGIAEDREGNTFIGDRGRWFGLAAIWKISAEGRAHLIAGTGHRGAVRTGVDALESDLGSPEGLSIDRAGRPYFADSVNHVVLRIETDGRLTRIAGTGVAGFSGDGGPATEATLRRPFDVRLDSQGNIYIADYGNNRVRKISKDGTIETVAGTGEPGYSGDGARATAAQLNGPFGIFLDPLDRLLITDSLNHVIRRVDDQGIIATVFGSGHRGYSGDGGPATAASFNTPESLHIDSAGSVYVGDELNHAIRLITPDGQISTVIGTGVAGFSPDGSLASGAPVNDPEYMFTREDGSMVISEGDNGRVVVIKPDGKVYTLAGSK